MKSLVQAQLSVDHRNAARLLSLMDRELEHLRETDLADMDLLRDIMGYMTTYPDKVHHPLEDLMFKSLVEREPQASGPVERMQVEHEELARRGKSFLESLELIVDGSMVEREALVDAGQQYSTMLRNHMLYENETLFPLAEQSLTEDTWNDIAARFDEQKDPRVRSDSRRLIR